MRGQRGKGHAEGWRSQECGPGEVAEEVERGMLVDLGTRCVCAGKVAGWKVNCV